MNKGIIGQVESRLAIARKKAHNLRHARSLPEAKEYWSEFLVALNRCFLRLDNAMDTPSERGWFARIQDERRSDELMCYLEQARNADEHGRTEIASMQEEKIQLGEPGGVTHIDFAMGIGGNVVARGWQGSPATPLTAQLIPAHLKLLPVVNRRVEYQPPKSHRGGAAPAQDAADIADTALEFFCTKFEEAKGRFDQSSTKTA